MPKRSFSAIESPPSRSYTRPAPSQPISQPGSRFLPIEIPQSQAASWSDDGEEGVADDVIISSQDNTHAAAFEYQLYGSIDTKIVGVQYYSGYATVGEYVVLCRQPSNQYDRNAIQVTNVQRDQIGHIPRVMASKLAKYMDNGSLLIEGSLAGRVGQYDCPLALKLFGTSDPIERANLRSQMRSDNLPCQVIDEKEREAKKRKAEELKKIAAAKKARKSGKLGVPQGSQPGLHSSQSQYEGIPSSQGNLPPSQSLDEIMETAQSFNPREMGEIVEKFGMDEQALAEMPMASCPTQLATQLLPYQLQGVSSPIPSIDYPLTVR